jgi:predicted DNA-binding transcriptional regulator AlpA
MSTKIEIEQISTYELEQLMRRVTREELQIVLCTEKSTIKMQIPPKDDLISRKQFLEMTGKSESWLNQNLKKNNLPYYRIGRSVFFKMSDVLAKLREQMEVTPKFRRNNHERGL